MNFHSKWSEQAASTENVLALSLSSGILPNLWESLARPDWFLRGTSIEARDSFPDFVTVADYIAIVGNMVTDGPDPGYHVDLIGRGIPIHRPGLDLALRYAPNLRAALELFVTFEPRRRKFNRLSLLDEGPVTALEFTALVDLGPAALPLVETCMLAAFQAISRNHFWNTGETALFLRHRSTSYADRLGRQFDGKLVFGASRNALVFPTSWLATPNMTFDGVIWQKAQNLCALEVLDSARETIGAQVRRKVSLGLERDCRVPSSTEIAAALGLSERTFLRRLKQNSLTYRSIVEDCLRRQADELFADRRLSLADIATRLGYSDASSFQRGFRRWKGVSPSAYRNALGK